jgi:hypothetical protein
MKLTNDTYLILISSARSAGGAAGRVVMPWPWNRRSSARRSRQRRLPTDNAKAATARSAAVGMETSSPGYQCGPLASPGTPTSTEVPSTWRRVTR